MRKSKESIELQINDFIPGIGLFRYQDRNESSYNKPWELSQRDNNVLDGNNSILAVYHLTTGLIISGLIYYGLETLKK